METTYGTLPPYGPAAETYRSAKRNLAVVLLLFFGAIGTIASIKIPALDVGAAGFGISDIVLISAIATFLASLFVIMLMYVNDEHQPKLLAGLTITMSAAAFSFFTLMHFTDTPNGGFHTPQTATMNTNGLPVCSNGNVGK